jgi:hypothetical protein
VEHPDRPTPGAPRTGPSGHPVDGSLSAQPGGTGGEHIRAHRGAVPAGRPWSITPGRPTWRARVYQPAWSAGRDQARPWWRLSVQI